MKDAATQAEVLAKDRSDRLVLERALAAFCEKVYLFLEAPLLNSIHVTP